jgi:hypothetical protein
VRALVLDHPAPFVPLVMTKRGKEIDYEAKAEMLAGRRYIVCRNHQEAAKDAADRASIVAALERQLGKGDKALVSNTGFRRTLRSTPTRSKQEKKFDGIFVLRTSRMVTMPRHDRCRLATAPRHIHRPSPHNPEPTSQQHGGRCASDEQ